MTRRELEQSIQALFDGSLEQADFEALEAQLRIDPEARAFYRKSMEIEMLISDFINQPAALPLPETIAIGSSKSSRLLRFSRPILAIAAVLLALAVAAPLLITRFKSSASMVCRPELGSQWLLNGDVRSSKSVEGAIKAGSTIEVVSGSLKLELPSGVKMVMRGPALASFPSLNAPLLQNGSLWVKSDASLEPVEIKTPGLRIRDVGTCFGVRIHSSGGTEVHMIEGLVEVDSTATKKTIASLKPTGNGMLIDQNGKITVVPIEDDPFSELPKLERGSDHYADTIRGQSPAGYWRLNEINKHTKILQNEIHPDFAAAHYIHSFPAEPAPNSSDGFPGFEDGNLGMRFKNGLHATGLYELDTPKGVSKTKGSLSFWIRKSPGSSHEETLWALTAKPKNKSERLKSYIILAQITQSGNLVTSLKTGGLNSTLNSQVNIADDNWHHVAYVWDKDSLENFIDGKSIGGVRSSVKGNGPDRPYQIRLAVTGTDHDSEYQPFDGWLDEVAIWDRKLSDDEILRQYEAALTRAE